MEEFKTYLDMSDDSLFENWNGLEHWKTRPTFRWSTGESNIRLGNISGVWCTLNLLGGNHVSPTFSIFLDGKIKLLEGEISTKSKDFSFFLPQGTKYITIKTQPWRPCDYGNSKDARVLGVGLTEIFFTTQERAISFIGKSPSSFAKELWEYDLKNPENLITCCEKMIDTSVSSSERIAAIYGCLMCLLEHFPGRKVTELDNNGKFCEILVKIDMPCFDEDGKIASVFTAHANSFWRTSMDKPCQENYLSNIDFLQSHVMSMLKKEKSGAVLFALSEDIVFLSAYGNIYLNPPQAELYKQLYFGDIAKDLTPHKRKIILRQVRQADCLKSYHRLKSFVEAPWVPADDELRNEIRRFRYYHQHSEKYDYLMGKFFLRRGDFKRAKRYAFVGLRRRRLDYFLSELMGDILLALGKYTEAANYYGRMLAKNAVKAVRHWMVLQNNELNADERTKAHIVRLLNLAGEESDDVREACVDEISRVLITERAKYGGRQKITYKDGKFAIVDLKDNEMHGIKSGEDVFYAGSSRHGIPATEYWKGKFYNQYEVNNTGVYILPVMALTNETELTFNYQGNKVHYDVEKAVRRFLPNQWQYLRLNGDCKIESNQRFMVAEAVPIKKLFHKRKIIINLLVDALSMEEIQNDFEGFMPNTYSFFSKGTIFNNAYGIADWTHPCTSSMFYGLNLRKHQLYHSRINLKQLPGYRNVAEELKSQGYFCCNYFHDIPRFLANDAYRGYDMHRSMGKDSEASIADAIHFIQVMSTNIFLNMHFMDVHDANFNADKIWTCSIDTLGMTFDQVMKSDMLVSGNKYLTEEEKRKARLAVYLHSIREMDRKLGILYEFLEKNYSEEEYLVVLHSDHGGQRYTLGKRHHTHTCLMARGDGIPHKGVVYDEVVSALDWFSIFEHCCGFDIKLPLDARLPKAFGGKGRDYAITQRLYPNQPYALIVNDSLYEYTFHTKAVLAYDGRADMGTAECHLYRHNDSAEREEVFDQELLDKYFTIAYQEAKYFDEPDENSQSNPFDNLLTENNQGGKTVISLVLDARSRNDFSSLMNSISAQSFKDFELVAIVEADEEKDFMTEYGNWLKGVMRGRVIPIQGVLFLQDVMTNLQGEYVLFLNGEEQLSCQTLEVLYCTAHEHKATVIENTYLLKSAEVSGFPEKVFQDWLHPLDGSSAVWEPVRVEGRVSTRYDLWQKVDNRMHIGEFFVRKDFLTKLGSVEIPAYGFDELLALYLFFSADSYVRISAPLYAYANDNVIKEPELCLETLLKCLNVADAWLKKIPYLSERSQMKENILAKFFNAFEVHYLSKLKPDVVEEAVSKVLHKHPAVSSWLVKYLFGRAVGK